MLEQDNLLHKYYDSKLKPQIRNERFNRPDVLKEQDNLILDIKEDMT